MAKSPAHLLAIFRIERFTQKRQSVAHIARVSQGIVTDVYLTVLRFTYKGRERASSVQFSYLATFWVPYEGTNVTRSNIDPDPSFWAFISHA